MPALSGIDYFANSNVRNALADSSTVTPGLSLRTQATQSPHQPDSIPGKACNPCKQILNKEDGICFDLLDQNLICHGQHSSQLHQCSSRWVEWASELHASKL